ncbi:hypothetical protein OG939_35620 [Streptomyces sp. NBC_01685]|uniref:hypothetical protein n=1 Tax=Streptomyces sp. NBC_01685 TaxID=2975910 RepID=UPI002E365881|nr:hypothetical protein [Streptomyces sp. NBC_01685]
MTKEIAGPEPIYDSVVADHGDAVIEARKAADAVGRQADTALNWSALQPESDSAKRASRAHRHRASAP